MLASNTVRDHWVRLVLSTLSYMELWTRCHVSLSYGEMPDIEPGSLGAKHVFHHQPVTPPYWEVASSKSATSLLITKREIYLLEFTSTLHARNNTRLQPLVALRLQD